MDLTAPSIGTGIVGTLCGQKFKGSICYINNKFSFIGQLILQNTELKDILPFVNTELANFIDKNCSEIFGEINAKATIYNIENNNLISLTTESVSFIAASKNDSSLFLFTLSLNTKTKEGTLFDKIIKYINETAHFFGIRELLVMIRTGNNIKLKDISRNLPMINNMDMLKNKGINDIPSVINTYDLVLVSRFVFEGNNSILTNAMSDLLGIKSLDLFIATTKNAAKFMGLLSIPKIENNILKIKDMYMEFSFGNKCNEFIVSGVFVFKFLPSIEFEVNCTLEMNRFLLLSGATMKNPVKLIDEFSIGDTELLIGYENGLTFGMTTNLYLRNLSFFAAIILKCYGEVVNIQLLSAAVSDLTITSLAENFIGLNIPDAEAFDAIEILGFDFTLNNNFPIDILNNDEKIINHFNNNINDKSLKLNIDNTKITSLNNGIAIVDKSKMRHYFIDKNGKLYLRVQFYYSLEEKEFQFGSYTVSPGMFLCGVICFFCIKIKIFFSINPEDGILAFLQISEFTFGLFKLTASTYSKSVENKIPLPSNSIIHQFITPNQTGAILFLCANKNNLSFYLDGRLSYGSIFDVDTRIIYFKKYISIDVRFQIFNIFKCSFSLKTDYQSANSLNFEIALAVDTTGLEKLFNKVTDKLEEVIKAYKSKMDNLNKAINEAQARVNNLQGEIISLDRRIEECKNEINRTSRWKRWIVAIAKGAEIAGYEVAKAGIYVAIGTATAALQAAKAAVNLTSKLGEGVLKAINGIIDGILKLFYIRKFELKAAANTNEQSFMANIEFVALGKEYKLSKSYSHVQLSKNPTDVLSDGMNGELSRDLNNINNGITKSNKSKFAPEQIPLSVHKKILQDGLLQINSSRSFIEDVQKVYFEEFGETLENSDEMNVQFSKTLDSITANLEMTTRMIDANEVNIIINEVKNATKNNINSTKFKDDEFKSANEVVENLSKVIDLHEDINNKIKELKITRQSFEANNNEMNSLKVKTAIYVKEKEENKYNMLSVIDKVEDLMIKHFPADRSNNYINFSKEKSMYIYFDEDREFYGGQVSERHEEIRSRIKRNNYTERL